MHSLTDPANASSLAMGVTPGAQARLAASSHVLPPVIPHQSVRRVPWLSSEGRARTSAFAPWRPPKALGSAAAPSRSEGISTMLTLGPSGPSAHMELPNVDHIKLPKPR